MAKKPDLDETLERHRLFWSRGDVDKPLLSIREYSPLKRIDVPLKGGSFVPEEGRLSPEDLDPYNLLEDDIAHEGLLWGDSFVVKVPYSKVPWMEAILGCPIWINLASGSMWSEPYFDDWSKTSGLRFGEDNPWFLKLTEFTRVLLKENKDEYLVAQTLMRGPTDMLAALLGDERMCYAFYDNPEEVKALLDVCTDAFIRVAKGQQALVPEFHGGYVSFFGIWAPGTVVRTQTDASALLSSKIYEEFLLPYDQLISGSFDYSIIHLHSGYLHTVDVLLCLDEPKAIQVSLDYETTHQSPVELIPIFQKILECKPLLIEGHFTKDELDEVLKSLPPAGLYIRADLQG